MYVPPWFAETRPEVLHALITGHPLGTLVTHGPGGLDANHVPFEFEPGFGSGGRLIGHVARANPVWSEEKDSAAGKRDVLVIFQGPQAYLSPNWYPSKHETHRQVPTWNYQVVHVHGELVFHDDEKYVRGVVARLTRTHERQTGDAKPWRMTDSAPDYIDGMLKNIVGIEIVVTKIVGKFKLSQNREARDKTHAAQQLIDRGQAVGRSMLDIDKGLEEDKSGA
ncbi:FMN-binding negative transcriptional regulator [Variovorax sp. RHLX14]|uniref:FMN-binding negative transcriptional regulator n=1 Tax=Variovorax sp. RHLX14 TaxID=1259731 RepID=UPI003F461C6E